MKTIRNSNFKYDGLSLKHFYFYLLHISNITSLKLQRLEKQKNLRYTYYLLTFIGQIFKHRHNVFIYSPDIYLASALCQSRCQVLCM